MPLGKNVATYDCLRLMQTPGPMLHEQPQNPQRSPPQRPVLVQAFEQVCHVLPLPGQSSPPLPPTAYRVKVLEKDRITTVRIPGGDLVRELLVGAQEAGFTQWRRGSSLFVLPHGETPA